MQVDAAYAHIRFERTEAIARLTLARPDKLNSLTRPMLLEINDAISRLSGDTEARVLLITGGGRGFCAGQDLGEAEALATPEAVGELIETFYGPMIKGLRALEIPVLAAVNGIAAGAGCSLALACDIVLAARSASFLQAFLSLGLIPDAGATFFLPRLLGPARAMALAVLAEPLSAEQAEAWGLIWRCVDDARLEEEALALARRLAVQPKRALALTKQALQSGASHSLERQLALEAELQPRAADTTDFREGLAAFLEKRPARFG